MFQMPEMKGGVGQTCLLHAYLFKPHLDQKDINQILHVRPFIKVGYSEDNGVILDNTKTKALSRFRSDMFYPKGKT